MKPWNFYDLLAAVLVAVGIPLTVFFVIENKTAGALLCATGSLLAAMWLIDSFRMNKKEKNKYKEAVTTQVRNIRAQKRRRAFKIVK